MSKRGHKSIPECLASGLSVQLLKTADVCQQRAGGATLTTVCPTQTRESDSQCGLRTSPLS